MKSPLFTLAAIAALSFGAQAQNAPGTVSIYTRTSLNEGDVRAFDEATGAPLAILPHLAGIRLHPIDFVGRTELLEFCAGRPRFIADVPSASRLVLPNAQGSLYRFSRETPDGRAYGFMHIDANGAAHSIAERIADPRSPLLDPYLPMIAVSPAGDSFLVATNMDEGGDVFEVNLVRDTVINRTERLEPLNVAAYGLGLQDDWGLIATHKRVLRFRRHFVGRLAHSQANQLHFELPTSWVQGELVYSMNGEWAMIVAGQSEDQAHVWAIQKNHAPIRVSVMPNRYAGAGFLPKERSGPFMAISDDGMRCAWMTETDVSRELHMARGPSSGSLYSEQLTRPLYFDDTLDEIGQTTFFQPDRLTFMAGARDYVHTGMNQADVFAARMPSTSGVIEVENLSKSSGETAPPFVEYGTIEPDLVLWSDTDEQFVIYDDDHNAAIFKVDPNAEDGQAVLLLDEILKLDTLVITRQGVLFDVRRTAEVGGLREMYRIDDLDMPDAPELVSAVPVETEFLRPAVRRDGWVTFVAVDESLQQELLSKVNVSNGAFETFAQTSQSYGPALGYTHLGSVLFSLETPGATSYMLWPFGSTQAVALQASPNTGFVLPPF